MGRETPGVFVCVLNETILDYLAHLGSALGVKRLVRA